jgi:chromosome segregation ATPase
MSSTIRTLEKEKIALQTSVKNQDNRLAELKIEIENLNKQLIKRDERYANVTEELRLVQIKQKEEGVKLAQAGLRDQELQKKIADLEEAERQRSAHDQKALERFQDDNLVSSDCTTDLRTVLTGSRPLYRPRLSMVCQL